MSREAAFLIAFLASQSICLAVVLYLRRPLHRVLVDLCGAEHRAWFWTAYSSVMMLLVPLTALLLDRATDAAPASTMFVIIDHLRASLCGLIISAFMVAMGVAAFIRPGRTPIAVTPYQVDSLEHLLRKVERMRSE